EGGGVTVGFTNLYLEPGSHTPDEIIASVDRGLYVTELIGFGVNFVTGDYSRGAAGYWIEGGKLTYPVEEITGAGNLLDMYRNIARIGRDLTSRDQTAAPTVMISRMPVAGQCLDGGLRPPPSLPPGGGGEAAARSGTPTREFSKRVARTPSVASHA